MEERKKSIALIRSIHLADPQPIVGEYDDSVAQDCVNEPLYGHPNVEWIRIANAPDLIIDERINPDPKDPNSDGIDFPPMEKYVLQIRMKSYIFLQYVSVPATNVVLLYVAVHYDSRRRSFRPYQSNRQSTPVVENFLTDEPIKFFEVHLNATDNGLPPIDVTLVAVCIALEMRILFDYGNFI